MTCECQNRKQEAKCQATKAQPAPTHEGLRCDDECRRLQRNAKLAAALRIDPAAHTDAHVPYADETLRLFRDGVAAAWAQARERELRAFADDDAARRLNFRPMAAPQRAFLHALAADYGLDSLSQDPEPLRHVSVFKTPRFVSAPRKTLAQCARILKQQQAAAAAAAPPARPAASAAPFNALVLSAPRFGLTLAEVDAAVGPALVAPRAGPALTFTTTYLPTDEVVLRASAAAPTAASVALGGASATPAVVETALRALKPAVLRVVQAAELAGGVALGRVDGDAVVRREGDAGPGAGGWSAVVGRAAARKPGAPDAPAEGERKAPSAFVALKRGDFRRKAAEAAVDDDWEAAAEKMDGETGA